MTEEIHNIKTVPVYYGYDIIGSAEIKTMKYVPAADGRVLNVWAINNIKINTNFKFMFLHLWDYHSVVMNAMIDETKFEGVAITVGYPNCELAIENAKHSFRPELKEIVFEDDNKCT